MKKEISRRYRYIFTSFSCLYLCFCMPSFAIQIDQASKDGQNKNMTNSLGMELVNVPSGSFDMGSVAGDWDEIPVHKVTINASYYMSKTEVTLEQFENFRPDHKQESENGMVTSVSWHDAVAFCEWLSSKEGKTYRLPTEAEWEYAGKWDKNSQLSGMYDDTPEWCLDWYDFYLPEDQIDPIGPEAPSIGKFKVVRGGKIDDDHHIELLLTHSPHIDSTYYHRVANRVSLPPNFGLPSIENADIGKHAIGFRIVQAELPQTKPYQMEPKYIAQGIKQSVNMIEQGPAKEKPYFRKRFLLPIPPDNSRRDDVIAAGLDESMLWHNHSSGLTVCPNGDVLATFFSAPFIDKYTPVHGEKAPNVNMTGVRLRYGADKWDYPEPFFDCADTQEGASLLWTDFSDGDGKMYQFWCHNAIKDGAYPFQWITSLDNGATWSDVNYPLFPKAIGGYTNQPISQAFWNNSRTTLFLSCDGDGEDSFLFATDDNKKTWYDTGGRTKGRHSGFCMLDDGTIFAIGGKDGGIGRYVAKSISKDNGASYSYSKTEFSRPGGNQRPSFLKLKSGNLFFASDWQNIWGGKPESVSREGSFVALSEDNGETWKTKTLNIPITLPHEDRGPKSFSIFGYSAAIQAPNGMIHLTTSMNTPCLHFEFNEAWILDSDENTNLTNDDVMPNPVSSISNVTDYSEKYSDNRLKMTWSAGIGDDGRYLLHGEEKWYYKNGKIQYEVTYSKGDKTGDEIFYRPDGSVIWEKTHRKDGSMRWLQYWENGVKKAESNWYNSHISGTAYTWDRSGKQLTSRSWPILTNSYWQDRQ